MEAAAPDDGGRVERAISRDVLPIGAAPADAQRLGRAPDGLKDGRCLARLAEMDFARQREDGRYEITPVGLARHAREVLKRPGAGR